MLHAVDRYAVCCGIRQRLDAIERNDTNIASNLIYAVSNIFITLMLPGSGLAVITKRVSTVKPFFKDHPIGHKHVVSRQVVFGKRVNNKM